MEFYSNRVMGISLTQTDIDLNIYPKHQGIDRGLGLRLVRLKVRLGLGLMEFHSNRVMGISLTQTDIDCDSR